MNYVKSSLWLGLKLNMNSVLDNTCWQIGDGSSINFWKDNWLSKPVVDFLNIPLSIQDSLQSKVSDFILHNNWSIPPILLTKSPPLAAAIS